MIIADSFLWLHLPKTGGTSMTRLFRDLDLPGVTVDPDDTRAKHDSVALRERRGDWRAGGRRRFISARRLSSWLLSDWHHKRRHMNLPDLPFTPVRSGLFYSLRLGGVWVAADWWLQYFEVDEAVTALRLEHLTEDLNRHLLPLLPIGTPRIGPATTPHRNSRTAAPQGVPDAHEREPRLDPADLQRIRLVNPRWWAWERRLYAEAAG